MRNNGVSLMDCVGIMIIGFTCAALLGLNKWWRDWINKK